MAGLPDVTTVLVMLVPGFFLSSESEVSTKTEGHSLSDLSPSAMHHFSIITLLTWAIAIVASLASELLGRALFIQTGIGLRIPGRFNQPYDVEGPSDHRAHRGSGDYLHSGDHHEGEHTL